MGKSIRSKKDKRLRTKRRALTEKHYAKFEAANQAVLARVRHQAKEEHKEAAGSAGLMESEAPRPVVVKKAKAADTQMEVAEGAGGDAAKQGSKRKGRKPNRAQILVDFDNSGKRKKRSDTKGKRNHQKIKWSDSLK